MLLRAPRGALSRPPLPRGPEGETILEQGGDDATPSSAGMRASPPHAVGAESPAPTPERRSCLTFSVCACPRPTRQPPEAAARRDSRGPRCQPAHHMWLILPVNSPIDIGRDLRLTPLAELGAQTCDKCMSVALARRRAHIHLRTITNASLCGVLTSDTLRVGGRRGISATRLATVATTSMATLITQRLAATTHTHTQAHAMLCARSALSLANSMGSRVEHELRAPRRGVQAPEQLRT